MRIAGGIVVVVLVLTLALLAMTWVSQDGELFAWSGERGILEVPEAGLQILPRWSWQRQASSTVTATVEARSTEGLAVTVSLRWRPVAGTYQLDPAARLEEAFNKRVGPSVTRVVAGIPIDCLAQDTSGGSEETCMDDPAATVAAQAATAIGSSPDRLQVRLEVPADSLRQFVIRRLANELPKTGRKVLLLGLDGLDWDLVLPWIRAGRMPNLDRLMRNGTWGTMETIVPTLSPLIWTSMATGVTPDRHGILDFVEKDPARGVMVPVTGRSRRVPALWNIASALGRSVGVVGWWGSWPAEPVNGLMVSDRLYYTLTQGLTKEVLREDPPEMIFPEDRQQEFVELRNRAVAETDWRALRYFMNIDEQMFDRAVAADRGMEDPVDGFRRLLAATRTYLGAGLLAAEEQPDLAMVYLEGTDTIGHLLAPYVPPPTVEIEPDLAQLYVAAVPKYFEIVDRWIGRYLEQYSLDDYAVVVVSDHGFRWSEGRPRGLSGTEGPTAALWHDPDAVFVVSGKGVGGLGRVDRDASIYDVAPTIAALLGLPADPGWSGRPLPGVERSPHEPIDYLSLVPPESYRPDTGDAVPVDPEFVSKLRALGYLGGTETGTAVQASPPGSPQSAPQATSPAPDGEAPSTRGELNNLAIIKIGEKKYEEAEALLRRAIRQSPDYPSPHFNLRRIFLETERYDDADRELWLAVDKGLRDSERTVDRAAADYESMGMPERAVALLEQALERFPEHEPFWVHLMVASIRLGDCQRGVDLGPRAASSFPNSAPVHAFYGLAAACAGDVGTARTELERSLELNPNQDTLRRTLADLQ